MPLRVAQRTEPMPSVLRRRNLSCWEGRKLLVLAVIVQSATETVSACAGAAPRIELAAIPAAATAAVMPSRMRLEMCMYVLLFVALPVRRARVRTQDAPLNLRKRSDTLREKGPDAEPDSSSGPDVLGLPPSRRFPRAGGADVRSASP